MILSTTFIEGSSLLNGHYNETFAIKFIVLSKRARKMTADFLKEFNHISLHSQDIEVSDVDFTEKVTSHCIMSI